MLCVLLDHAPREKDGEDGDVTFRRPRTRMDEPSRHFPGVKRPSGCRENDAPSRIPDLPAKVTSRLTRTPPSSNMHRRHLGTTRTRIAVPWADERRPGHRSPDAKRRSGGQTHLGASSSGRYAAMPLRAASPMAAASRGTSAAAVEADLEHPGDQSDRGAPWHMAICRYAFLDWCTIFCTRPPRGANCHPILALAPPIQMNIARRVRRVDPSPSTTSSSRVASEPPE